MRNEWTRMSEWDVEGQDYLFSQGVKMNPVGAIHESPVRVIHANMRAHRDAPLHIYFWEI